MPNSAGAVRQRGWGRRLLRWAVLSLLAFIVLSLAMVLTLRWLPPPSSAFMLARSFAAWRGGEDRFRLRYEWRSAERVSRELPIALVAAEDQKFPYHRGFDWGAIEAAWRQNQRSGKVRGASTISQQTAKNLFLWSGRSWLRKGLELYFTTLIELLWPKQRILEIYLNIAEFGDGVYGAQAASRLYFRKDAGTLSRREAALLAAVLPSPRKLHADRPSAYVRESARWIERQVGQLGGPEYLQRAQPPAPEPGRASRARRR